MSIGIPLSSSELFYGFEQLNFLSSAFTELDVFFQQDPGLPALCGSWWPGPDRVSIRRDSAALSTVRWQDASRKEH